ncbi:MAG: hypothetical protein OEV57_08180 [Dehalococcoidia bacterium]|nr:hypothetical protein [Dehalococcoidia bacterium]
MKEKQIKRVVKGRYARLAKQDQESRCPSCGCGASSLLQAKAVGYSTEDAARSQSLTLSEVPLPDQIKSDSDAWACRIGGALEQEYLRNIRKAGFERV